MTLASIVSSPGNQAGCSASNRILTKIKPPSRPCELSGGSRTGRKEQQTPTPYVPILLLPLDTCKVLLNFWVLEKQIEDCQELQVIIIVLLS